MPDAIIWPVQVPSATFGSIATTGSAYQPIGGPMPYPGEVLSAYFVNGTTASATSGTTTGSSASIILYKNASNSGSRISTFNGSGTNVATLASALLAVSGTAGTTNGRFAAGDQLIVEFEGGVANNGSNAGCYVVVNILFGRATGGTPSAGTGPA